MKGPLQLFQDRFWTDGLKVAEGFVRICTHRISLVLLVYEGICTYVYIYIYIYIYISGRAFIPPTPEEQHGDVHIHVQIIRSVRGCMDVCIYVCN